MLRFKNLYAKISAYKDMDDLYKQKAIQFKDDYYSTNERANMNSMLMRASYNSTSSYGSSTTVRICVSSSTVSRVNVSSCSTPSSSTKISSSTISSSLKVTGTVVSSTVKVNSFNGASYTTLNKVTNNLKGISYTTLKAQNTTKSYAQMIKEELRKTLTFLSDDDLTLLAKELVKYGGKYKGQNVFKLNSYTISAAPYKNVSNGSSSFKIYSVFSNSSITQVCVLFLSSLS